MCISQNFKAFKDLFVAVVSLLNPNGTEEMYGQAADDLIAFETSLAQVKSSMISVVLTIMRIVIALNRSLSVMLNYEILIKPTTK